VQQVHRVLRDPPVHRDLSAKLDLKVQLDLPDLLVRRERLGHRARRVIPAQWDPPVRKVPPALRDRKDSWAHKVRLDRKDLLGPLAPQ